ncbi:MAG: hypothetical protein IPK80_07000 [Nannocystis sp.]|nr:hypothetical protein [Nannocystis sp.]
MHPSSPQTQKYAQVLRARAVARSDGTIALHAPAVGLWRGQPAAGALLREGAVIGQIEQLGALYELVCPAGAHGIVAPPDPAHEPLSRRPVAYDDLLLILAPQAAAAVAAAIAAAAPAAAGHGLSQRAPSSGRFYGRPSPERPPFLRVGDQVHEGQVIGLLEVMKTFTRIHYGGGELPTPARVTALLVQDDADVAAGDPLIAVEPLS